MKYTLLIPRIYQLIGWISLPVFATLGISNYQVPGLRISWLPSDILSSSGNDLSDELAVVGSVIALQLISFAKQQKEDEYTLQIRLVSWQWAIIFSYLVLIILNFTTYGLQFNSLLVYHAFVALLTFPLIFHYYLSSPGRIKVLLLPTKIKKYGWIILLIFIPLGLASIYLGFQVPGLSFWGNEKQGNLLVMPNSFNLTNELILTAIVAGLFMVSFAKNENEDEYISHLRLTSWQWSIVVSSLIFIIITLVFYGSIYYHVLLYNVFTPLVVFIARFYYRIDRLNKVAELVS